MKRVDYDKFWSPAFDAMGDFVFILDRDRRLVGVNESFAKFVKKSRKYLIGKKCYRIVHRSNKPFPGCPHLRSSRTKAFTSCEIYEPRLKKWLSMTTTPIFDDHSRFIGSIHVATDTTERKKAEDDLRRVVEMLKESEEKYRALVHSAQEGVGVVDPEENLTFVNPAFADMLGYKEDELVGKNLIELTGRKEFQKYRRETRERKKGESGRYETILYHKDGHPCHLSVSAAPLWEGDGSFRGTLGVLTDITQRKQSEEVLKRAKEYTENIVSSMTDALVVMNASGMIQTVNQAACDLLDCGEGDLIGQPIGIVFAEEEEEEEEAGIIEKRFRKLLRKGPVLDFKALFSTKGGEKIPVSIYGSVMRSEKGKIAGIVLTARDVRERLAAEKKLKESEERYRGVVENITDAIFVLNDEGRFVHMNQPGLHLYGFKDIADIADRDFVKCSHKKYWDVLTRALEGAWSGNISHCHYESTAFDGTHRWWECDLVPFRDESGRIINVIGIGRDITPGKQTEKTLEYYREYADNVVANMPASILVVNRDGQVNFANKNFLNKMGLSEPDVLGNPLSKVLGPTYSGLGIDDRIRYVIGGGREQPFGRFHLKGMVYDYKILPIRELVGRRLNAMLIMEDVTEKMSLEDQLRQSEKMSALGQFTAGVAHEINNPLSIIKGNIQYLRTLLAERDKGEKQLGEEGDVLDVVEKESTRCGEIISNLLYFSRRPKGERVPVDLNKVVRRTVRLLGRQLMLSNVDLKLSLDEDLGKIRGDEGLLQQVMMNLVVNSQQAMHKGGMLFIDTANVDDEAVVVRVTDTGGGISEKDMKNVFNPYFTTKEPGKGTGLGLSIVHSIVTDHGGEINVENTVGKRRGAMFILKFHAMKV